MATVRARVKQRGNASDALTKLIRGLGGSDVVIGVPKGSREADGTNIALIAAVHEFGSPARGIPERSFLRSGIKGDRDKLVRIAKQQTKLVAEGTQTPSGALTILGLAGQAAVQRKIRHGEFAPLKPATIRRKTINGLVGDKPLIDTGNLVQSITYEIRKK